MANQTWQSTITESRPLVQQCIHGNFSLEINYTITFMKMTSERSPCSLHSNISAGRVQQSSSVNSIPTNDRWLGCDVRRDKWNQPCSRSVLYNKAHIKPCFLLHGPSPWLVPKLLIPSIITAHTQSARKTLAPMAIRRHAHPLQNRLKTTWRARRSCIPNLVQIFCAYNDRQCL